MVQRNKSMELLTALVSLFNRIFIPLGAYIAGLNAKENEQLENENKKLKEYREIDDKEIQVSEVYDEKAWK